MRKLGHESGQRGVLFCFKLVLQEERDLREISKDPQLHSKLFKIAVIAVMIVATHFYIFFLQGPHSPLPNIKDKFLICK